MKKLLIFICVVAIFFSSCAIYNANNLKKPDEFEFDYWLLDLVDIEDFDSRFDIDPNLMGARAYFAEGYKVTYAEFEGDIYPVYPEEYVQYIVGGYPDFIGPFTAVIGIRITDPDVHLWGLTVNSSYEEFRKVMISLGFFVPKEKKGVAYSNKYTIYFLQNSYLYINYNTSNILFAVS